MITLQEVKANPVIDSFIRNGNKYLGVMGFTEHSYRHVNLVSSIARNILERLGYPGREAELAAIAGYLHDVGNVVSRSQHGISGALIAFRVLEKMGMEPDEMAKVISAIANHEEEYGQPVNTVAAALILADKSDVHRSRVRNPDIATFDIHDRVNYAVEHSFLWVHEDRRAVTLELTIDIEICPVMEYFEIFLTRMALCRRAANFLNSNFELVINGAKLL
ncbi:HD domain-containing protein [Candidatus Desulforudis audaxviator]|uniref:Metal dependent phosphohydrolase n=1 Tax=Desulforudis audaxviator (strain MP104C) TaxID=477974 RepID=B1I4K6_DESAP|nr:HD domain-containing protein [Candidatus Desulforudis audaxviator]ACA59866.1 metal dependent phosphohydrolase [Candidatus Desulforudis audaxviator MP104C]AZK59871.1 metal dependent phosphohydrolase [Candidatus Desulforudis audaxviator]